MPRIYVVVNQQFLAMQWYGTVRGAAGKLHVRYESITCQGELLHHHQPASAIFTMVTFHDALSVSNQCAIGLLLAYCKHQSVGEIIITQVINCN